MLGWKQSLAITWFTVLVLQFLLTWLRLPVLLLAGAVGGWTIGDWSQKQFRK